MRFLKLAPMVHILSLTLLLVAAMPFMASEPPMPGKSQAVHDGAEATVFRECDDLASTAGHGLSCSALISHCLLLMVPDPETPRPLDQTVVLYHPFEKIDAPSLAPESQSPPPRV